MKYDMVEEMKKSITTGELGKSKSLLVNSLLWNENEETVKALEVLVEENNIFVEDNREALEKKDDETQKEYIDRINTEIKLNFSKEKYLALKEEFKKYHLIESNINSNNPKIIFTVSKDKNEDEEIRENGKILNQNETKKLLLGTAIVASVLILTSLISKNKRKNR